MGGSGMGTRYLRRFGYLPVVLSLVMSLVVVDAINIAPAQAGEVTGFTKAAPAEIHAFQPFSYTFQFSCSNDNIAGPCTVDFDDVIPFPVYATGIIDTNNLIVTDNSIGVGVGTSTATAPDELHMTLSIPAGGSYELEIPAAVPHWIVQDGTVITNTATAEDDATGIVWTDDVIQTIRSQVGYEIRKTGSTVAATGFRQVGYTNQICGTHDNNGIHDTTGAVLGGYTEMTDTVVTDTIPASPSGGNVRVVSAPFPWTYVQNGSGSITFTADFDGITSPGLDPIRMTTGCYSLPQIQVEYYDGSPGSLPASDPGWTWNGNAGWPDCFDQTSSPCPPPIVDHPNEEGPENTASFVGQTINGPQSGSASDRTPALQPGGLPTGIVSEKRVQKAPPDRLGPAPDDRYKLGTLAHTVSTGLDQIFYNSLQIFNFDLSGYEVVITDPGSDPDDSAHALGLGPDDIGTTGNPNIWDNYELYRVYYAGTHDPAIQWTFDYKLATVGTGAPVGGWTQWSTWFPGTSIGNVYFNNGDGNSGTQNIASGTYVSDIRIRIRSAGSATSTSVNPTTGAPDVLADSPLPVTFQTLDRDGWRLYATARATSLADGSPVPTTMEWNCANHVALDSAGVPNSNVSDFGWEHNDCAPTKIRPTETKGVWIGVPTNQALTIGESTQISVYAYGNSTVVRDTNPSHPTVVTDPTIQLTLPPGFTYDGFSPSTNATWAANTPAMPDTCTVIAAVGTPPREVVECTFPPGTILPSQMGVDPDTPLAFTIDATVGPLAIDGYWYTGPAITTPDPGSVNRWCTSSVPVNATTWEMVDTPGHDAVWGTGGAHTFPQETYGHENGTTVYDPASCMHSREVHVQIAGAVTTAKVVSEDGIPTKLSDAGAPGDDATWRLAFTNTTDDPVTNFVGYDKLPLIGDSSIITGLARNSTYVGPMTGPATALSIASGVTTDPDPAVTIEYATDVGATCINASGVDTGACTWMATPSPWSAVTWIKVTRTGDLPPNTIVYVDIPIVIPAAIDTPTSPPTTPNAVDTGDVIHNTPTMITNIGQVDGNIASLYVHSAELGDYVWYDMNGDGLQDLTDVPAAGVTVNLLDATGAPVMESDGVTPRTTTTNGSGLYLFTGLMEGDYIVEFDWSTATNLPGSLVATDLVPTTLDVPTDDEIDSDGTVVPAGTTTTQTATTHSIYFVTATDPNYDPLSCVATNEVDASGNDMYLCDNLTIDLGLLVPTSLEVVKTVSGFGVGGAAPWSFAFTLTPAATPDIDLSPATGTGNGTDNVNWVGLIPGTTYTLNETTDADYVAGALTCTDATGAPVIDIDGNTTDASITFVAPSGSGTKYDVNCTITNTPRPSDIQITKTVDGFGSDTVSPDHDWSFDFTLTPAATPVVTEPSPATGTGNGTGTVAWTDLVPGTEYVIAEANSAPYTSSALTCTGVVDTDGDANNASVTFIAPLGDGDPATYEVTCEITNTAPPSDIEITKIVDGLGTDDPPSWAFDFTLAPAATPGDPSPATGTGNGSDTVSWTGLTPGETYTITETVVNGYESSPFTCTGGINGVAGTDASGNPTFTFVAPVGDGDPATFEVTCEITNTPQPPDLEVTKTVEGFGAENPQMWDFVFTLAPTATDGPDVSPASGVGNASDVVNWNGLVTGTEYVLSETGLPGYLNGSVAMTCVDPTGAPIVDSDNDDLTATFIAPAGDGDPTTYEVNCAITNTVDTVEATVEKTVAGVADTEAWSFDFTITPTTAVAPVLENPVTPTLTGIGNTTSAEKVFWSGLVPGAEYVIAETPIPAGFTPGEMVCTGVEDTDSVLETVTFIAPVGDGVYTQPEVECSITNTARPSDVEIAKTVSGFGDEAPHDWSFEFTLTPSATDGPDPSPATGTGNASDVANWTGLIPGTTYTLSETTVPGYAAGALTCTMDDGDAGTVDVEDLDGDLTDASIMFVAPLGDDNDPDITYEVTCTIENTVDPIQAQVTKTVEGIDVALPWSFDFTITPTGAAAPTVTSGDGDVTATGVGSETSLDTATWDELIPGSEYVIAEIPVDGYTSGVMVCEGVEDIDTVDETVTFIAPVGDSDPSTFEVDCAIVNTVDLYELEYTKVVSGDGAAYNLDTPFEVTVVCSIDGIDLPIELDSNTILPGEVWYISALPLGAECTITETDTGNAYTTTIDGITGVETTVTIGEHELVVIENVFELGSFTVSKTVEGPGAILVGDVDYGFSVACTYRDEALEIPADIAEFTLKADELMEISGIPIGAECTITETDPGDASSTTADGTGGVVATIVVGGELIDGGGDIGGLPVIAIEDALFVNTFDTEPVPSIEVEKSTNGKDADLPADAPAVKPGDSVTWTYTVTNTGNVDLGDVSVVDDRGVAVTCPDGLGIIDLLEIGESVTCSATGKAVDTKNMPGGVYKNVATVTGTPVKCSECVPIPGLAVVTATDPSHYKAVALPKTGASVDRLLPFGLVLVALGALAVLLGRRRRREDSM